MMGGLCKMPPCIFFFVWEGKPGRREASTEKAPKSPRRRKDARGVLAQTQARAQAAPPVDGLRNGLAITQEIPTETRRQQGQRPNLPKKAHGGHRPMPWVLTGDTEGPEAGAPQHCGGAVARR